MRRHTVLLAVSLLVVLLPISRSFAQIRLNPGDRAVLLARYRSIVANYCRQDYDGARLSPEKWARIQPLTTWRENPEFQAFSVITRYQVLPDVESAGSRYIVSVQYDIAGRYDMHEGYLPDPGQVTIQYELEEIGGAIRISNREPLRPFVGGPRFLQWIQAKLNDEKDPASRAILEASMRRFQEQTSKKTAAAN